MYFVSDFSHLIPLDLANAGQSHEMMNYVTNLSDIDALDVDALASTEKQMASLKTYTDSLPYNVESAEKMQAMLEEIVGKILISVKTKNWLLLTSWDGKLQR
jgi:hypothetical protein